MQLHSSTQRGLLRPVSGGSGSRHSTTRHPVSTRRHALLSRTSSSRSNNRATRVRCDSRDAVEVIAFSAEDLAQEVRLPSVEEIVAAKHQKPNGNGQSTSNGHSTNGHSNGHASNGNGHSTSNGHASNGNGHKSNGSKAHYEVVSSSNSTDAREKIKAAQAADSHAASSNGHSNGHKNGNGRSKDTATTAAPTASADAAAGSSSSTTTTTATATPAAAPAPAAVVDLEQLAQQAADAWASCAPALQLPGQQLSSVTFDCGVSVTINRTEAVTPGAAATDAAADTTDDAAADAAVGGLYYVRVSIPPDFGPDCVLHWGVENWQLPAAACRPPSSKQHGERAVRTPFAPVGVMPIIEPVNPADAASALNPDNADDDEDTSATEAAAAAAPPGYDPVPLYPGVPEGTASAVTLVFPEAICPERFVFVVHQLGPDAWVRDHGANFSLQLRSPCLSDLVEGVLAAESGYEHWGLLHRLQRVLELLDNAEAAGAAGMAFMFTWLRLSGNKLLDWQRCFSYQPRDITWAQQQVVERISEKARCSPNPAVRMYGRMTLSKLSRGGGNGDEIRMGILNIMRDHGIKEGNRGGLDEPFLEEWHQKIHQASSPEDVIIAEAYLAYLHTANHDDWWRVLSDNGITKERLESWEQPITSLPMHLPQLIPPMQHYHWVLKTCHAGAELDTALTCAQGFLDPDLRWHLYDLLANRNAWWAPGKTLELRRRLKPYWQAPGSSRDLLLLDIALESWLRMLVERQDKRALSGDDLVELMGLVLGNAALPGTSAELELVAAQWEAVRACPDRWSRNWCLAASAALGRVTLALSAFADDICSLIQPYAELFGLRCSIPTSHILNFSEEVVRDQALFVGSLLAAELEPRLRQAAGASSWQVVSQVANATGEVVLLPNLNGVQGVAFERPTVVLAQSLGGMEDIPDGVVALLTRSSTDVLSHVAIRARTQGVLLAGCADEEEWKHLVDLQGQQCSLSVASNGDVIAAVPDAAAVSAAAAAAAAAASTNSKTSSSTAAASADKAGNAAAAFELKGSGWRVLVDQQGTGSIRVLQEHVFNPEVVGAKACNLAKLRQKLPDWILVPRSIALPFGTFEAVLTDPANAAVAAELTRIEQQLAAATTTTGSGSGSSAAAAVAAVAAGGSNGVSSGGAEGGAGGGASPVSLLERARELVTSELKPPAGMQQMVFNALVAADMLPHNSSADAAAPHYVPVNVANGHNHGSHTNGNGNGHHHSNGNGNGNGANHHHSDPAHTPIKSGPMWTPTDPNCPAWSATWASVCAVWASKWNHRAWLSRQSAGLPEQQLAVSVLIQQVLPGQYAFVLHTASPFSGERGEMYGELVCGLGETLVGNHPGRPLAFSDKPDGSDMQLLALPSKREGLFAPPEGALIARSDTNGEDLEGYAGAGLYDSVPMTPLVPSCPDYASEPIMWDAPFRQHLLDGLVELGYAVEAAFDGQPQDIEGVWMDGRLAVVQARPQVLSHCASTGDSSKTSSASRQRAKALAAAQAAEAAAAVAAVRESGSNAAMGSGEWEWDF